MKPNFEWDEEKAKTNLKKHRVDFDEAATVFLDPLSITIPDPDHSTDERRYVDVGSSERGRVLIVVYVERGVKYVLSVVAGQLHRSADCMKKAMSKTSHLKNKDMRAEYDFSRGVRGRHCRAMQAGYTVTVHKADGTTVVKDVVPKGNAVLLEPDVHEYFPDSESVNQALRCLIPLLPKRHRAKARCR